MHSTDHSESANSQISERRANLSQQDFGGRLSSTFGVSPYDSDVSIDAIVEHYHPYILVQVKRMAYLLRKSSHSANLHADPEDIAQEVSLSFWKRLRKEPIDNPEAYIKRMVRNEYIDTMRKCHINIQPLPVAENGELLEGEILLTPGEGMSDPAEEFEEQAAINDLTERVAEAVSRLPSRQQRAASLTLLKKVDNLLQVVEAFEAHRVPLEIQEPEDEDEKHRLQASFSPARHALAKELDVDLALYNRPVHCKHSSYKR